ncbi:MAG: hypothetical protein WA895_05725, partial [Streptosporangiaceae bacterium]
DHQPATARPGAGDGGRMIPTTRERVPEARVLAFPGGHLTTSEHPELLAATIREIAGRHGVGTPATAPETT